MIGGPFHDDPVYNFPVFHNSGAAHHRNNFNYPGDSKDLILRGEVTGHWDGILAAGDIRCDPDVSGHCGHSVPDAMAEAGTYRHGNYYNKETHGRSYGRDVSFELDLT